ncbi:MAG TPA: hypothetical protein VIT88_02950 [Pyrinomonadaceae bacterium]
MKRNCLVLLVSLLLIGCNGHSKQPAKPLQSPLTPVAQEIQRRGYHVKESLIVPPTLWEVSTFRMRSKRSFAFRSDQPQSGTSDYFVRFRFFEETYDSIEDARHRLANLHMWSPDASAEVNEYDRVMRSGFRVGTVVYFLQTDAIVFWDEVKRFANEISGATPGAELTRIHNQRTPGINRSTRATGGCFAV